MCKLICEKEGKILIPNTSKKKTKKERRE